MATDQPPQTTTTSDDRTPKAAPVTSSADDRTHQRQRRSSAAQEEEDSALRYFGGIAVDTKRIQQCSGCGCYILDAGLLRLADDCWHSDCLRCSVCQVKLQDVGTTCFTRAEMILCRSDYVRLFGDFGSTCARCGKAIPSDALVMRTSGPSIQHIEAAAAATQRSSHHRLQEPSSSSSSSYEDHHHHHHHYHHHHQSLYHLDCFSCIACDRRLNSGDQYGIIEGNVLCDRDFARFYEVI